MRLQLLTMLGCLAVAAPVSAQTGTERGQDRGVTVRLEQVLEPMAADLDLPDVLLPETVHVPETIASEVCGAGPGELAGQGDEQASCTAVGRNAELTRFVQEGMVVSGRPVDAAAIDEDLDPLSDGTDPQSRLPGEAGDLFEEPGDPDVEEGREPPATATSPGVNGDDPLDAAPSDIREPADMLPEPGQDAQPSPGPAGPPDPGQDAQPSPGPAGPPDPGQDAQPSPGPAGPPTTMDPG